jgi:hypothetical protein
MQPCRISPDGEDLMHYPTVPRTVRPAARSLLVLLAIMGVATTARTAVLPDQPSAGLRVTVSVGCDFEERWWEAALHPGSGVPLEFRSRTPGMLGNRDREAQRALSPDERAELYGLVRAAFEGFRVDRRPDFTGPGSDRPWTGERTITLAALVLDDELGRVDRAELAIDVIRGRSVPVATLALVDAVAAFDSRASFELDCG